MYKKRNLLIMSICIALAIFGLNGCETKKNTEVIVSVIVAGNHENSQKVEWDLENMLDRLYKSFGNIAIVINDGTPDVLQNEKGELLGTLDVATVKESREKYKNNETRWKKKWLSKFKKEVMEGLECAVPDSAESDLLAALSEAKGILQVLKEFVEVSENEKIKMEILICDTGLSTYGGLNFLEGEAYQLLGCERKIEEDEQAQNELSEFLDNLERKAEIPDLKGIDIRWYGLGAVALPQISLTPLQRENLEYIWQQVLEKSGADCIKTTEKRDEEGYFQAAIEMGVTTYEYGVTPVVFWTNDKVKIFHKQLGFKKNSAELESEEVANEVIKPYANNLMKYPDMKFLICGTVADDRTKDSYYELSKERAETVKRLLVEQGIDASRIKTFGLGIDSQWHQDEWKNGEFNETIAIENRAVYILAEDSQTGRRILEEYGK